MISLLICAGSDIMERAITLSFLPKNFSCHPVEWWCGQLEGGGKSPAKVKDLASMKEGLFYVSLHQAHQYFKGDSRASKGDRPISFFWIVLLLSLCLPKMIRVFLQITSFSPYLCGLSFLFYTHTHPHTFSP